MRNKIKQGRSRLVSFLTVCVLLLTALLPAVTVSADGVLIDYDAKGTINIYKYYDSTVLQEYGNYASQEELAQAVEEAGDALKPLEGVVFTYLKVGDIAQSDEDATATDVTIGYSIDVEDEENEGELLDMLEDSYSTATRGETLTPIFSDSNGIDYYSVSDLQTALDGLSQTELRNYILSQSRAKSMEATNDEGFSTTDENDTAVLDVGLYLIVETAYPPAVSTTTDPFFVSIPMTDSTTVGDVTTYEWIYEINAYPKNSTSDLEIDKVVVEDGNESQDIDGEIGQSKVFKIRADLPATMGTISSYVITDTLSIGLTYNDAVTPVVYGLTEGGELEELDNAVGGYEGQAYYTFSTSTNGEGETVLTFNFINPTALTSDGTNSAYTMIEIVYEAYLNENAVVGYANENDVLLQIGTKTSEEAEEDITPVPLDTPAGIYTYAISLQKQFDGANSGNFTDVTFVLYDADGNAMAVASAHDDSEDVDYWYVFGTATADDNTTITVESDGTLILRGLEAGTYYLEETGTADGYNLLAERIEIIIISNEGTYQRVEGVTEDEDTGLSYYYLIDSEGTYTRNNTSYIYAYGEGDTLIDTSDYEADQLIKFKNNDVYYSDDDGESWTSLSSANLLYSAGTLDWTATVGGSEVGDNNGTFGTINVNNQSGFNLPATGGSGTFWFIVGGGIIVAIALVSIYAVTRKKGQA